MPETVLRMISDATRLRRVLIVRRGNGSYGWEAEYWSDEPLEQSWVRIGQRPLSVCDSEETAVREAMGRVDWLASV